MAIKEDAKTKALESLDFSGFTRDRVSDSFKRTKVERQAIRDAASAPNDVSRPINYYNPYPSFPTIRASRAPGILMQKQCITNRKKERYLIYLERYGQPTLAASKVGLSPSAINSKRRRNKTFDAACEDARDRFYEKLQCEALVRINEGSVTREVEKSGKHRKTRVIRKQSDMLLRYLLEAEERKKATRADRVIKGSIKANSEGGMDFVVETPPQIKDSAEWESTFRPGED